MSRSANSASRVDLDQCREAIACAFALLAVISFGTIGFLLIEPGWTVWKSLFFTLITITTVGYGDEGLSKNGEMFAVVLLLVGIATATYSFSAIIRFAVSQQIAWRRKMRKKIGQLDGHFVICGFGRIGKTVCRRLANERVPFVVIENDALGVQEALDLGYLAINGNSTEDDVLREAGVERASGVVCVVNSDAENVFIALSAREMNNNAFIASRADADGAARKIERAGASLVVSPYASAGSRIATAILKPHLTQFLQDEEPAGGGFELSEIRIDKDSRLAGQTVREFGMEEKSIVFVAIRRANGEVVLKPAGDVQFVADDIIFVAGRAEDLLRMYYASIPVVVEEETVEDNPETNELAVGSANAAPSGK